MVIYVLALMMLPVVASAQTEFEGEVSGEWDTDGSPYIQVGNAQVPGDESLTILPGVEVILGEDMTLTCNGVITAQGTEEDTIRIHGPGGLISGRILLQTEEDTARFAYCRFDSLDYAIWFTDNRVIIEHCLFNNNRESLRLVGGWVRCRQNYFHSDSPHLGDLKFGLGEHAGSYTVEDNFSNLRPFLFTWADDIQFNGNSTLSPEGRGDNISSVTFWFCQRVNCSDNNLLTIQFNNSFRRLAEAIVENNQTQRMSFINISNWGLVVRNNIINEGLFIGDAHVVVSENVIRNRDYGSVRFEDAVARFDHNLLEDAAVMRTCELEFINNTFVSTRENDASSLIFPFPVHHEVDCSITMRNNILANFRSIDYAIYPGIEVVGGGYNCFMGVEHPYGDREELLEGDIIENPLMRGGLPYDYRLRVDSPCLDVGDPDSPRDPDGTRADIGRYYFDQENGEPPALNRHWDYYIGWHETFRYAAIAVDEGEELQISFEGLPEWLEIEEENGRRDFVRDSVVVSGVVPEDQEDFVFQVLALDDADREDTLSVRVMVYPYRVLTGVVSGVLDVERSPFIVADTAWIPAGDSLVLPPGTELYFDNREDSLADRAKSMLMVMGAIKAVGEEGDSIYFGNLDTSRSAWCIKFLDNPIDISEFAYCHFKEVSFDYTSDRCNIWINNSTLTGSSVRPRGFTIKAEVNNNLGGSISLSGKADVLSNMRSRVSVWRPDTVRVSNNDVRSMWIWFGSDLNDQSSLVLVENNIFRNEVRSLYYDELRDENLIFNNNTVFGHEYGLSLTGSVNSRITNNLVFGSVERALVVSPFDRQTTVVNNVFMGGRVGIYAWYSRNYEEGYRSNLVIENNLISTVDTLLYSYRNRTEGIRFNSLYNFGFLSNDTTFDSRLARVNANGDSCDVHFNIYLDPRLANPDSLDFRLYADSPLIDAGNPDSSFNDVNSTINDIGLFGGPYGMEYEYPEGIGESDVPVPEGFTLGRPYPNPFNTATNFSFTTPAPGDVEVKVYDTIGMLVFSERMEGLEAGSHRYTWRGVDNRDRSLPTGIYYFELTFRGAKLVKRMVMLK